ncbi:hypothetical protein ACVIWV_006761 [Bradyrhizobium diazoefficiens]|jgi:hypothetical protein|uniref:Uncharacterized protein n=1 Tax=Bradyrhizobium diazoefficiens TaxID=1355477 RepID=A0A810AGI0_9BRAD|nr:hypothetical protein [Bradyrhizobium japonicum]BBZ91655.1 hypothetical protein F07S3_14880 [Bradyrhizobium diazoefficiens]MBP1096445.1 hypothetical protein [Bradyrhizobium japonicum]BCA00615.1 hypothetical protein H12S4_15190 [Bradyrhizobium diazoefficiens]BCA09641.1 hypothetical protein BDHF08_14880 [Bradyrhizobium diazoefficiens]
MLLSAMRQRQAGTDTKSTQLFTGTVSFSRHMGRLNGPRDVGRARAGWEVGVSTKDD